MSAAFSSDGTRVVTANTDKTARVWDAGTGKPILPAPLEHQANVVSAAFSPDGTRVITASWDKTARVWDAGTGKPLSPPLQHQASVWNAAFSPDGTRVVTASDDKTARIWDVPLASGTLADRRRMVEHASPYILTNGVPTLRTLDASAGPSTPGPTEEFVQRRSLLPILCHKPRTAAGRAGPQRDLPSASAREGCSAATTNGFSIAPLGHAPRSASCGSPPRAQRADIDDLDVVCMIRAR